MKDILSLSSAIIDGEITSQEAGPINRINHTLSELNNNIAMVEAFSHSICLSTDEGLVVFDTSNSGGGALVVEELRRWRHDRVHSIVYTHGHVDHVGGCGAFISDASKRNFERPIVIGHENVRQRFQRYEITRGYNSVINERQFGRLTQRGYGASRDRQWSFDPSESPAPDLVYNSNMELNIGGTEIVLNHAKGETDDHTWAWIPSHKAICAGDFFIWSFPNAGNPQKAQRYPAEWARAMRSMAGMNAELFLPAHGLPITGRLRIRQVLLDVANTLEKLVSDTLDMMNEGARLNEIIHCVSVSSDMLEKPYLKPIYDEPEFIIQNIWRLYGGWYDGNPANLKPAKERDLAVEIAGLVGGAVKLAEVGLQRAQSNIRLACHLVEMAALASPTEHRVHELRAEVYRVRRAQEQSLMAKGIFRAATEDSEKKINDHP